MPASPALIALLARKLLQTYASQNSTLRDVGDLLLGTDKLEEGLKHLFEHGLVELGKVTEESEFTPAVLKKVLDGIAAIQAGTGVLKPDGVLGAKTLKWLLTRPFGHDERPPQAFPPSRTTSSPKDQVHALRYFVENNDELPKIAGLSDKDVFRLFRAAWQSWGRVCNIDIKQTANRADANVLVSVALLPGQPVSVVAIASVGPPGGHQLSLRFDRAETWTPNMFQATACHEIGHLLGLDHSGKPRQLMNDTLHEDIKTPQDDDIARAVKIWGAPPA